MRAQPRATPWDTGARPHPSPSPALNGHEAPAQGNALGSRATPWGRGQRPGVEGNALGSRATPWGRGQRPGILRGNVGHRSPVRPCRVLLVEVQIGPAGDQREDLTDLLEAIPQEE